MCFPLAESAADLTLTIGQLLTIISAVIAAAVVVGTFLFWMLLENKKGLNEVERTLVEHSAEVKTSQVLQDHRIQAVEGDMKAMRKRSHDILGELQALVLNVALIGQKMGITELNEHRRIPDEGAGE